VHFLRNRFPARKLENRNALSTRGKIMKNAIATICAVALVAVSSFAFAADNGGGNNGGNNNGNNSGVDATTTNSTNNGIDSGIKDTGTQDNKAADPNCDNDQAQAGCNNMQ
jgi:hypothetical protein